MRVNYPACFFLLSQLALASPLVQAEVGHRFSGFATLGIAINDNPDLVFRNDVTQNDGAYKDNGNWLNDSRLGVQWQGLWSPQWETAVQLVAKDRFDNTLANSIEWAFVRYRPVDGLDLRLGRLGADAFMLSEHRQVGYTLPWVRPPHDLYGITSLYSFDGLDLGKRIALGDASLNLKAFYGNSNEKYPTGFNNGQFTKFDFDLSGISGNLEWSEWKLRYSYVEVDVNSDLTKPLRNVWEPIATQWAPAGDLINSLETQGKTFRYHQIGLNYDNNNWWLQSEFVRINSDLMLVTNGEHFYASLGKRFGSINLYGLAGYATPETPEIRIAVPSGLPEPFGSQLNYLAQLTEERINAVRIKQYSYGVGARWDFARKIALKLQVDKFHVDSTGTSLWFATAPEGITGDQRPLVISLAWDVLF